jgi:hypothetical protein
MVSTSEPLAYDVYFTEGAVYCNLGDSVCFEVPRTLQET